MKREIIRVEPLSTYLERWKAPTSAVTRHGDTIYVSGFPPCDPKTGEVAVAPIERQTELVLEQLKLCVETAGSSLEQVLKCNVYCTSVDKFAVVNEIYARYFPKDPPARIFINVPAWPGSFDIEIDCIAALDVSGTGSLEQGSGWTLVDTVSVRPRGSDAAIVLPPRPPARFVRRCARGGRRAAGRLPRLRRRHRLHQ
jgi:2-iminobutanoate/2-iminopropanoate deaminase